MEPVAATAKMLSADPSPQFTSTLYGAVALDCVKLPKANDRLCPSAAVWLTGGITRIVPLAVMVIWVEDQAMVLPRLPATTLVESTLRPTQYVPGFTETGICSLTPLPPPPPKVSPPIKPPCPMGTCVRTILPPAPQDLVAARTASA